MCLTLIIGNVLVHNGYDNMLIKGKSPSTYSHLVFILLSTIRWILLELSMQRLLHVMYQLVQIG
jgi:hypothetical protein